MTEHGTGVAHALKREKVGLMTYWWVIEDLKVTFQAQSVVASVAVHSPKTSAVAGLRLCRCGGMI